MKFSLPGTPMDLGTKTGALTLSAETDETMPEFDRGDWIRTFELLPNFNMNEKLPIFLQGDILFRTSLGRRLHTAVALQ